MNTIKDTQVSSLLTALHKESETNYRERYAILNSITDTTEREKKHDELRKTAFMSVSPEEGSLLYFLANYAKAKHIVEFGCSFGISTIYLAAAAKNNNGRVITTELEASKIAQAEKNITKAGLEGYVIFLSGDATQTLTTVEGDIDFLFLDGAKELYLPVFKMLEAKLSPNAIVYADNTDKPEAQDFVDYIQSKGNFNSTFLFGNKVLLSSRL
ncbi:O-methyltransferase [Flavobacterium sp. RHBU_3]|uniref:O-methyltransferase n=1 Tax=Flavobacterium sp. RHBU_3 TaxID=3391184 RepID=UPI0039853E57